MRSTQSTNGSLIAGASLRRLMTGAAVLAITSLTAACGASDTATDGASDGAVAGETIELTFASGEPETHPLVQKIKWFMDEVAERSDGKVKWKTYYAASLLPSTEIASGVGEGRADAGLFTSPYDPTNFPLYNIGYVPYPEANAIGAARGLKRLYEENDVVQAEASKVGVKMMLHLGSTNPATLLTKEPLHNLEDIKGMKLRFIGAISKAIEIAGATPIAIPAEEIYESQERGVTDGVGGASMGSIPAYKFYEVAPYIHWMPVGHFSSSMGMVFNESTWEGLPQDIQQIMTEVQDEFYEELVPMTMEEEAASCQAILDGGATVLRFPDNEAQSQAWLDDIGNQLFETWRSTAMKAGVSEQDTRSVEEDFKKYVAEESAAATEYTPGEELCIQKSAEKQ